MSTGKDVQFTIHNHELTTDAATAKAVKAVFNAVDTAHKTELEAQATANNDATALLDKQIVALNAEKTALEAAVTPEAIALNAADLVAITNTAKELGIDLPEATVSNHELRVAVINGSNHPDAKSFTADTSVETVNAVFNGLSVGEPKGNGLSGTHVAQNASMDDVDKQYLDRLMKPASREQKGA